MEIFYYVMLFIFGAAIGSFVLVFSERGVKNQSIIKPDSQCDHCHKKLKWYHKIPILSYIFLGGKCAYCHKKISPLCIICEMALGLLFVFAFWYFKISYNFFIFSILSVLTLSICITDFKYMIILDIPLFFTIVYVLTLKFLYYGWYYFCLAIISAISMFLILLFIKKLGDLLFKRESLGGGDIKLALVIGSVLDFRLALVTLILSTFLALPYALTLRYLKKEKELPFGPFIITSLLIVFVFADKFANLVSYISF